MKISFDFDGTLSKTWFQRLARSLVDAGVEVFIVTSRCNPKDENEKPLVNKDIWAIGEYLRIPYENIFFTEGQYKATFLDRHEIDIHFDDNPDEIQVIQLLTSCKAVNFILPE